mmetsp:Transcript_39311/g.68083  ORF Transcript_39311/g.68083 Transcript_39311/m.68083 type:complete len:208 (+) Transcript_39311:885-1508(+)
MVRHLAAEAFDVLGDVKFGDLLASFDLYLEQVEERSQRSAVTDVALAETLQLDVVLETLRQHDGRDAGQCALAGGREKTPVDLGRVHDNLALGGLTLQETLHVSVRQNGHFGTEVLSHVEGNLGRVHEEISEVHSDHGVCQHNGVEHDIVATDVQQPSHVVQHGHQQSRGALCDKEFLYLGDLVVMTEAGLLQAQGSQGLYHYLGAT